MFDKTQVILVRWHVALATVINHDLVCFGNMAHHGHIALMAFICPLNVLFVGDDFTGLNVQRQGFTATQGRLEKNLINRYQ